MENVNLLKLADSVSTRLLIRVQLHLQSEMHIMLVTGFLIPPSYTKTRLKLVLPSKSYLCHEKSSSLPLKLLSQIRVLKEPSSQLRILFIN